jgi:Tol biopolymer transport system component
MRGAALLVMATGCGQIFGLDSPQLGDAASIDVLFDGPRDAQGGTCIDRWMQTPQFATPQPLTAINTSQADRAPFVTADGTTLYYVHENDFFVSIRPDSATEFGLGTRDDSLSSGNNDNRIFVAANHVRGFLSSNRGGTSGFDLWRATRATVTDSWTVDAMEVDNLNGGNDQLDPFVSDDLLRIYYATKGTSGNEIKYAERLTVGASFAVASPLAGISGGVGSDEGPTSSSDERVIVFSTTRGGSPDLWYAKRNSVTSSFGSPQPLVSLNNSTKTDAEPYLSPDGCTLYFASDRAGSMDLYRSTLLD